jgi:hypothetical protein
LPHAEDVILSSEIHYIKFLADIASTGSRFDIADSIEYSFVHRSFPLALWTTLTRQKSRDVISTSCDLASSPPSYHHHFGPLQRAEELQRLLFHERLDLTNCGKLVAASVAGAAELAASMSHFMIEFCQDVTLTEALAREHVRMRSNLSTAMRLLGR